MREYIPVLLDHFALRRPIGLYWKGTFTRISKVLAETAVPGKGRCYTCLVNGEVLDIWQMYDADRWFTEREAG